MNLNELIKKAHDNATEREFYFCNTCGGKGFFEKREKNEILEMWACKVCKGTGKTAKENVIRDLKKEIKEFKKAVIEKDFSKDSEQSEIADIILILLAYCGEMNINIGKALIEKSDYNEKR